LIDTGKEYKLKAGLLPELRFFCVLFKDQYRRRKKVSTEEEKYRRREESNWKKKANLSGIYLWMPKRQE
jgi:hypothetical protein